MWLFQKANAPFVYMWHVWDIPPKLFHSIYIACHTPLRKWRKVSIIGKGYKNTPPFSNYIYKAVCVCMQMVHIWYKHVRVYCMYLWQLRGQEFETSFQVWPIVSWGASGAALFLYFYFWHFTVLTFELVAQNHDGSWVPGEINCSRTGCFVMHSQFPQ